MSRWGLTLRKRYRHATRYCVNCEICSSVVGVVSRPLAAGLRQFDTRRRFITSPVTAAVSGERRRSAHLFLVEVPAHHSAPPTAAQAEGSRADCIQTISPRVQSNSQTISPHVRVLVIVQCLRSDSSYFGHYNRSCLLTYLVNQRHQ